MNKLRSEKKNHQIIKDIIIEIEKLFPVKRWVVNKLHMWPLLRVAVRPILLQQNDSSSKISEKFCIFYKLKNFINRKFIALYEITKLPFFFKEPVDFIFYGNGISKNKINNKMVDYLLEPLMLQAKESKQPYIFFETYFSKQMIFNRKQMSFFYLYRPIFILARIIFLFKKIDYCLPDLENCQIYAEEKKLGKEIFSLKEIILFAIQIQIWIQFFKFFLRKYNPKVAFIASYYHMAGFAFNQACRDLHIKTVEIQHGWQEDMHDAYNFWNQLPEEGYGFLPKFFWTWTKRDAHFIEKWSFNCLKYHSPYYGGIPSLLGRAVKDPTLEGLYENYENIKKILVTLQPLKEFSKYWDNLAWVIRNTCNKDILWVLKHHPVSINTNNFQGIEQLMNLNQSNVRFVTNEYSLPNLLQKSDIHITVLSSAALEASFLGVPSIFISNEAYETHKMLILEGYAHVYEEKDKILQAVTGKIRKIRKIKNISPPSLETSLRYFLSIP